MEALTCLTTMMCILSASFITLSYKLRQMEEQLEMSLEDDSRTQ